MGVDNIAANLPEGMKLWKIAVTPVEQAKLQQALAQMRSTSNNTESVPSIENLYLSKPLDINSRIASPEVQEFYGHNNR